MNIEQKCTEIQNRFYAKQPQSDLNIKNIIIILMVISIVISIIRIWMACRRTPGQLVDTARSPSRFEKLVVRRYVAAALKKHPEVYDKCGHCLTETIIEAAADTSIDEMDSIFDDMINYSSHPSIDTTGVDDGRL